MQKLLVQRVQALLHDKYRLGSSSAKLADLHCVEGALLPQLFCVMCLAKKWIYGERLAKK